MKVEELRIGNWVMGYHDPFQWSLEHFDLLKQADLDEIIKEPVLITEEVLLKCGFEIKPNSSLPAFAYSRRLDLQVEFMLGEYSFRIEVENRHTTFVRVIKYLHELQNLYFSITGEELEVEL